MGIEEALAAGLVLIVAAHPDDETIGVGGILPRLDAVIVHLTDGAPRNPPHVRHMGFDSREEYALARRQELLNAMCLAGIGEERLRCLDLPDEELALCMSEVTRRVAEVIRELRPRTVLTHAYEGGNSDHDTCSFAVAAACRLIPDRPLAP